MKVLAVDMQGFSLETGFHPKEITITNGKQTNHYLLKPFKAYQSLSLKEKKQVCFEENNIHGLRYSSGYVDPDLLPDIVSNHLLDADIVYVKGHQKIKYLNEIFASLRPADTPTVINIETCADFGWRDVPVFERRIPQCINHSSNNGRREYLCSLTNASVLIDWVNKQLP